MSHRSRPLAIAHVTATFPPYAGGAGNTAFRFAQEQAARGHRVEVFTARRGHMSESLPDAGQAIVHRVKPVFAIGNAPLIPAVGRIEGFDVVHVHYPFIFGAELVLLGRLRRRRRSQALLIHYKNRLMANGLRGALFEGYEHTVGPALARAADRICVLSSEHVESVSYLRQIATREPEKLIELPNGVDSEVFAPGSDELGLRTQLGISADATVCVFVGTLDRAHHFKRVDVAIDALAALADSSVHLIVAGGGELLEGFRRRAAEAGVVERVHFLGAIPHADLPGVLRAADLLLLTTEPPESFGIVLIEAMAAGLPVVATDYPGVRAIVDDEVTGLLAPRGDAAAVAAAVSQLIADPERRREMGERGRVKSNSQWSWPSLTDRMDVAYKEAINARAPKT